MPVEINDLECKRFGIVAARLTDSQATPNAIDQAATQAGVDLLTARVEAADLERVHALEGAGYRLMDTLVYYGRSLDTGPESAPPCSGVALRLASGQDKAAVVDLAQAAFSDYIGHYHADPRLDNAAADAAYVDWAMNSVVTATAEHPVLVVERDAEIAGFLTLRRNSSAEIEIVLNAVHPRHHGHGLYGALVSEALRQARTAGAERVIVSTQINNYAVQRVWARLGFTHYRSLYTFHKWYTP